MEKIYIFIGLLILLWGMIWFIRWLGQANKNHAAKRINFRPASMHHQRYSYKQIVYLIILATIVIGMYVFTPLMTYIHDGILDKYLFYLVLLFFASGIIYTLLLIHKISGKNK